MKNTSHRTALRSGTALAVLATAGLLSPFSVERALADCVAISNTFSCEGTSAEYTTFAPTVDGWIGTLKGGVPPVAADTQAITITNNGDFSGQVDIQAGATMNGRLHLVNTATDRDSTVTINIFGVIDETIGTSGLLADGMRLSAHHLNVNIGVDGRVEGGDDGFRIDNLTGDAVITNRGTVYGNGNFDTDYGFGIEVNTGNTAGDDTWGYVTGNVTIDNYGTIEGHGASIDANYPVGIQISTSGMTDILNNAGGIIFGEKRGIYIGASNLSDINVLGGNVVIVNAGRDVEDELDAGLIQGEDSEAIYIRTAGYTFINNAGEILGGTGEDASASAIVVSGVGEDNPVVILNSASGYDDQNGYTGGRIEGSLHGIVISGVGGAFGEDIGLDIPDAEYVDSVIIENTGLISGAEGDGIRIDGAEHVVIRNLAVYGEGEGEDEDDVLLYAGTITGGQAGISVWETVSVNIENEGRIAWQGLEGEDSIPSAGILVLAWENITINNSGLIEIDLSGTELEGQEYKDAVWGATAIVAMTPTQDSTILLDNSGTISGAIWLMALGSDESGNAITFNNTSNDTWRWTGPSVFSTLGGSIELNNTGTIRTYGESQLEFDASGEDATFNNTGLLSLQEGDNGEDIGYFDTLTIGNFFSGEDGFFFSGEDGFVAGGSFVFNGTVGEDNGTLAIDAELSPGGDGGRSDLLVIYGSTTGTTVLDVNDLDDQPGMYDPEGRLFAQVSGDSPLGSFVTGVPTAGSKANSGIDKGLFRYDAYRSAEKVENALGGEDDAYEWVLASTFDREAYEFPVITYGAQNLWHASTGVFQDRTAGIRSFLGKTSPEYPDVPVVKETADTSGKAPVSRNANSAPSTIDNATGLWARAYGSSLNRDMSNTSTPPEGFVGPDHTYTSEIDQGIFGFTAGFDFATQNSASQTWVFGMLAGYAQSNLNFSGSNTDVDYKQASLGTYMSYISNGFYTDAIMKVDFGTIDYAMNDGVFADNFSADYISAGATIEAGYRMNLQSGWYVEPKATLAYVVTDIDGASVLGTGVSFADGDSLRGRIGAKAGTAFNRNGSLIEPYFEASLWNEFDGDYTATLSSNGLTPSVGYDAGGTYGEVAIGTNIINTGNGWSAFVKGSTLFGDDGLSALSGNLGFRKVW